MKQKKIRRHSTQPDGEAGHHGKRRWKAWAVGGGVAAAALAVWMLFPIGLEAQFNLGLKHYNGEGVPKDDAQAVNWFRKAAEQGHAGAQYTMGLIYRYGDGVPKDDSQAVNWYRKAAEQGHADAQESLGFMYDLGWGVPRNVAQAVNWYRKAAEQGRAGAQRYLGLNYEYGVGVPKNYVTAYAWNNLAASQGNEAARESLGELEVRMASAQVAKGQRLSQEIAARIERRHASAAQD